MPVVHFPEHCVPTQIEGFPSDVSDKEAKEGKREFKRSCSGALHLHPGSTKTITADELGFIQASNKEVASVLRVLVEDEKVLAPKPADVPAPAPDPTPAEGTGKKQK